MPEATEIFFFYSGHSCLGQFELLFIKIPESIKTGISVI